MASLNQPANLVSCPNCAAKFDLPASAAGKRGRCAQCGTAFIIPHAAQQPEPADELPVYIGVDCKLCGTRMYGGPEQVGKEMKCPDCGARTVLPPPPKPKPKNIPAAMEGEQYELWEPDAQPLPSEMVAHQPKFIAVSCRRCNTLMYASEQQVGETIACPDCGSKHVVPPPPKPKPVRSPMASDAELPALDPARDPGERPVVVPPRRLMDYEEQQDAEYAKALEESRRTGRPMKIDHRGRPVMPRWPLLTGVLPFLFYRGCPARWVLLALGLLLSAGLVAEGLRTWISWTPKAWDFEGGMMAMAGLAETFIGGVLTIIWIAGASNVLITIVSHSAVGSDRIAEWPPMNFIMSMSEMLPVTVAAIVTAAPGWMLGQFLALEPQEIAKLTGGSLLLGFPVVLLSQLAANYTWELIDLKVLGAMIRRPLSMIVFYIESAGLAAICAWAAYALWQRHELLPLALTPLYIGCLLIYARLLGRLAWILSDAMPSAT